MIRNIGAAAYAALVAFGSPAAAHMPGAPASGPGAGFLHPLTGLDHLAAALMVGLLAARFPTRGWQPMLLFLAVLVSGMASGAHRGSGDHAPLVMLLSMPLLATILVYGGRLRFHVLLSVVGLFAFVHGHAHGSAIAGLTGWHFIAGVVAANALLLIVGLQAGRALRYRMATRTAR